MREGPADSRDARNSETCESCQQSQAVDKHRHQVKEGLGNDWA